MLLMDSASLLRWCILGRRLASGTGSKFNTSLSSRGILMGSLLRGRVCGRCVAVGLSPTSELDASLSRWNFWLVMRPRNLIPTLNVQGFIQLGGDLALNVKAIEPGNQQLRDRRAGRVSSSRASESSIACEIRSRGDADIAGHGPPSIKVGVLRKRIVIV